MPTIKEIRDKYHQYDDMPDGVLAAKLHKKYYSDMPFKDFAAKVNLLETPNKESLYEGFIKPTVKAIPKVVGSTAAQMALMPGAGVKGVADLLGGKSLEEANRGMEETMSFVTPKLNTAEQQGVENIGLAMKPFQMAGEGWGEIGKATGIPYAEPILATMGEASAIFGFGGAGKAAKARVNQAMAPLEGIIPKTQGKPYAVSPEVPRQVDPAYVRAAFEKEQPLALPNASYEGQGPNFIIKPKTILEKGYTVGNVNPDLVVENVPYRKRKITHEVKAEVKPIEPPQVENQSISDEALEFADNARKQHIISIAEEFNKKGAAKVVDGRLTYIVHKSTKQPGKIQVSVIDEKGPVRDFESNNLREALDTLTDENISAKAYRRPDLPDTAYMDVFPEGSEYVYEYRSRPMSIGTQPEGFIKGEEGGRHGRVVYDRPLTKDEIYKYELNPIEYREPKADLPPAPPKETKVIPTKVKSPKVKKENIQVTSPKEDISTPKYNWADIDKAIEESPDVKPVMQISKVGSKWELSYPETKRAAVQPGVKPFEYETTIRKTYKTKEEAKDAYYSKLREGQNKYPPEVNKIEIKSGHGGSYKIWNTKEALTDFKKRVIKQFPGKQSTTLFSGIDPTQIKNIGKWVANTAPARKIAGFFQPELSVPQGKEWLYSRQQAKGQSAIGEKYAEGFVKKHKDIKPEDRQLIWEQMNSGADIKTLPKELQKPALEFRVLDNSLGRMLVDNGLMSEETFKANAGNHIRYIYNIYQQGGDLAMGMGQKLDTKFIKPRKDLSDLQRQQLGLVKDPIQAIANSIADTHRAVGMAQHFKTIAENPDWVFEPASVKIDGKKMGIGKVQKMIDAYQGVERSGQPLNETQVAYRDQLQTALQEAKAVSVPKDYIQLNGSQYGALDGQYVRKAIAQDIKPILDVFKSSSETANKVVSGIVAANGLWKMKNVALNIPTAARNTISNPSQLLMSGMRPDRVVTRTAQAIVEMAKKGKYHDEALQQGLFKGNFATGELEDIIQIARGFDANNWTGFLSKVQSLGKYYGKIDDVFKLAKFIDVREAGKPATEAAYQANKWGMDYSVAHPAIKILRNSPIGAPFISYQYKIAPLIAESLVKRPWIVGGIASIPWLLQKAVTQNMTDEDATKYIESLPEYVKNKQVFLIPGVNGMNALDVSYMVPWGNWFQVADSVRDTKVSKAFKQMGVASGLLPSVLYGVTTGKDLFTGEKIISDLEKYDPKAAAWATTKWIWQQAAPPMLTETSVVGKVSEHIKHGQTSKGLKTEGMNVWPRIVGVNIYPVDPSGKAKAERFELKNVRKALIRKMYDKNISAEERKAATDAYRMAVQKVRPQPEEERTEETDSEI